MWLRIEIEKKVMLRVKAIYRETSIWCPKMEEIASGGTTGCVGHKHRRMASISRLLALSGAQGLAL
ncbi:hypothetical protein A2U01_0040365, partial [Trifolium medium]|nr:hypothetical protein [Trifolium medium]